MGDTRAVIGTASLDSNANEITIASGTSDAAGTQSLAANFLHAVGGALGLGGDVDPTPAPAPVEAEEAKTKVTAEAPPSYASVVGRQDGPAVDVVATVVDDVAVDEVSAAPPPVAPGSLLSDVPEIAGLTDVDAAATVVANRVDPAVVTIETVDAVIADEGQRKGKMHEAVEETTTTPTDLSPVAVQESVESTTGVRVEELVSSNAEAGTTGGGVYIFYFRESIKMSIKMTHF